MGDGVLVYFGYPQAHEDDAERAVRAGLAVIDAVRALNLSQPLAVRLGIATGLVVVGDLIGEGAAQERGVVGETPNLAARLQAIAAPNRIVIADGTRRQLGGLFEVEDLGPQPLPGFAEAPRAWRVLGESGVVSRFEALRAADDPARRPRRGTRAAAAPLAAGQGRRGPGRADRRRARHRQVATDRGAGGEHRRRAAHAAALFLVAAPSGERALPVHRPARTRRRLRP